VEEFHQACSCTLYKTYVADAIEGQSAPAGISACFRTVRPCTLDNIEVLACGGTGLRPDEVDTPSTGQPGIWAKFKNPARKCGQMMLSLLSARK
jgi:hypothetical protein